MVAILLCHPGCGSLLILRELQFNVIHRTDPDKCCVQMHQIIRTYYEIDCYKIKTIFVSMYLYLKVEYYRSNSETYVPSKEGGGGTLFFFLPYPQYTFTYLMPQPVLPTRSFQPQNGEFKCRDHCRHTRYEYQVYKRWLNFSALTKRLHFQAVQCLVSAWILLVLVLYPVKYYLAMSLLPKVQINQLCEHKIVIVILSNNLLAFLICILSGHLHRSLFVKKPF